jgi:E3 ubiquitin-protein transferase RMND5
LRITENDALSSQPSLVNRAIAMHLLREGQFKVASIFIEESKANNLTSDQPSISPSAVPRSLAANGVYSSSGFDSSENKTPVSNNSSQSHLDSNTGPFDSKKLQEQFADMYYILSELRENRNLSPAITWARRNSAALEARGSNLEFELCKLQFTRLYTGQDNWSSSRRGGMEIDGGSIQYDGPLRAWAYARSELQGFHHRYGRELQQLVGTLPYWLDVAHSPYAHIFYNEGTWEEVAHSFTREFCSLLGLSADSPLYLATTAGAIALPTLVKLQAIMKEKRTEWTSQNELPVSMLKAFLDRAKCSFWKASFKIN